MGKFNSYPPEVQANLSNAYKAITKISAIVGGSFLACFAQSIPSVLREGLLFGDIVGLTNYTESILRVGSLEARIISESTQVVLENIAN